jgi:L-2-hydroxyglutarate oxidase
LSGLFGPRTQQTKEAKQNQIKLTMVMSRSETCDFLIVGAGILGVSIARELRRRYGGRVLIVEKEASAGQHASGRNSGVIHSGVYYKADTLKARLCVEGNRRMRAYCHSKALPMNARGKVIVAKSSADHAALQELQRRAVANGVRASLIDQHQLAELEPYAKTVERALFVEDTAVVNPRTVVDAVVKDAVDEGIEFEYSRAWVGFPEAGTISTSRGPLAYGHLVNCAGLWADRIAHACGVGTDYRILPFRGLFYRLHPQSQVQVHGNIYPVPDLRNPFLGVHFTRRPDQETIIGPSALPLLGREQYVGLRGATWNEASVMARYLSRLMLRNLDHFRSMAWREITKISKTGFYRDAAGLVTGLAKHDLLRGQQAGIRAQLVHVHTAQLLDDFVIEAGPRSTHILNAVSPAFTSAFPFAEYVAQNLKPH